ncbi:LytR family transcriptional regulator [Rubneribacter badeniensis]|uniref:LytR family transcriptional regulator n=1 Tax=Rubneribacter badeniensis TaxID=2070688 RepID=A0A2K2U7I2_9ACTN|nr:LCP family protein [Rubneribacter badeniensis]PNV66202.1 LytR family transcriptional regulator [Rubneribacter badeniensis]
MTPRNSRTNRPAPRSSREPQSARAARSVSRATQSERVASSAYRPAYTPGSQGRSANGSYGRQSAASQYSRTNPNYTAASSKRASRGKKIALCVVAAVLVAVIGTGTAFALYINSINDQLNHGTKTQEELNAITDVLAPKTSSNFTEPFYMMLIGSDRRVGDDSMGARSDTNIVVRVDPTQNLVTMVSIPRDTCIEIDGYGQNKFNAAYNYGGAAATIREASELCNIEISHYAEVNFEELVALVDAVGGVDVEVDERIDDPDAGSIVIEEGTQHLDGEAALVFARSRAYVDGDFTRTANQRKLIMALVEKVLALPVTDLPGVIQSAAQCVTTDLSVSDILSLAQQFKDEGDLTIYSAMVPSTTGYIGEVSYVFTDEAALKEMMEVVEAGEDPSGIVSSGVVSTPGASSSSSGTSSSSSGGSSTYDYSYNDDSTYYDDSGYTDNSYYDPNYGYDTGYDSGYVDPGYTDPGYSSGYDAGYADPGYDSGYVDPSAYAAGGMAA